jgi:hypothetical protein
VKYSGTLMTVGSLVAAMTFRVAGGGAGVVCAAAESAIAIAPSSSIPIVLIRMRASRIGELIAASQVPAAPREWRAAT